MKPDGSFFRGSELPRFLVLACVMVAGWVAVYVLFSESRAHPERVPGTVGRLTPLPPPDDSPEFQSVLDRRPMSFRDNAAYSKLLARVRETPYAQMARESRQDVLFSQLIETPKRYRGLPVHIEGTVLRALRQDAKGSRLFPKEVYYEAYVVTADSMGHPWFLAFEDAPAQLQIGDNLQQRITFDGFFLKLVAYQAADTMRLAPVLVGRFPPASPPQPARRTNDAYGMALLMVALTVYVGFRLFFQLRRNLMARRPITMRPFVTDQIDPDALSEWIERSSDEGSDATRP